MQKLLKKIINYLDVVGRARRLDEWLDNYELEHGDIDSFSKAAKCIFAYYKNKYKKG